MKIILAPSKTMTMARQLPQGCVPTTPHFLPQAEEIAAAIRKIDDLQALMRVSQAIAEDTVELYDQWGKVSAPAVMSYVGDVYKGFYAETLSTEDLGWAQQHLCIMSGLYGVLRPFDLISPYRLEMKAKLAVDEAKNLYEFWEDALAAYVDLEANGAVCILSSDEYAKPITKYTKSRVVTPIFLDNKNNGKIGTVPIYSKMMRGVLARWMIDNRVDEPSQLKDFSAQGYSYDAAKSTANQPVFFRHAPSPIQY